MILKKLNMENKKGTKFPFYFKNIIYYHSFNFNIQK